MIKILAVLVIGFLAYYYYFSPVATCMRDAPHLNRTTCAAIINKNK